MSSWSKLAIFVAAYVAWYWLVYHFVAVPLVAAMRRAPGQRLARRRDS